MLRLMRVAGCVVFRNSVLAGRLCTLMAEAPSHVAAAVVEAMGDTAAAWCIRYAAVGGEIFFFEIFYF